MELRGLIESLPPPNQSSRGGWKRAYEKARQGLRVSKRGKVEEYWNEVDVATSPWLRRLIDSLLETFTNLELDEKSICRTKDLLAPFTNNTTCCHYILSYPSMFPAIAQRISSPSTVDLANMLLEMPGSLDLVPRDDLETILSALSCATLGTSPNERAPLSLQDTPPLAQPYRTPPSKSQRRRRIAGDKWLAKINDAKASENEMLLLGTLIRKHPSARAYIKAKKLLTPLLRTLVSRLSDGKPRKTLFALRCLAGIAVNTAMEERLFRGKNLDQTIHLLFNLMAASSSSNSSSSNLAVNGNYTDAEAIDEENVGAQKEFLRFSLQVLEDLMGSVHVLSRIEVYSGLRPALTRIFNLLRPPSSLASSSSSALYQQDIVAGVLRVATAFLRSSALKTVMFSVIALEVPELFWGTIKSIILGDLPPPHLSSTTSASPSLLRLALHFLMETTSTFSSSFHHRDTGFHSRLCRFANDPEIVERLFDLAVASTPSSSSISRQNAGGNEEESKLRDSRGGWEGEEEEEEQEAVAAKAADALMGLCDLPYPKMREGMGGGEEEKQEAQAGGEEECPECLASLAREGRLRQLSEATIVALARKTNSALSLAALLLRACAGDTDAESVALLLEQDTSIPALIARGLCEGRPAAMRFLHFSALRTASPNDWWRILKNYGDLDPTKGFLEASTRILKKQRDSFQNEAAAARARDMRRERELESIRVAMATAEAVALEKQNELDNLKRSFERAEKSHEEEKRILQQRLEEARESNSKLREAKSRHEQDLRTLKSVLDRAKNDRRIARVEANEAHDKTEHMKRVLQNHVQQKLELETAKGTIEVEARRLKSIAKALEGKLQKKEEAVSELSKAVERSAEEGRFAIKKLVIVSKAYEEKEEECLQATQQARDAQQAMVASQNEARTYRMKVKKAALAQEAAEQRAVLAEEGRTRAEEIARKIEDDLQRAQRESLEEISQIKRAMEKEVESVRQVSEKREQELSEQMQRLKGEIEGRDQRLCDMEGVLQAQESEIQQHQAIASMLQKLSSKATGVINRRRDGTLDEEDGKSQLAVDKENDAPRSGSNPRTPKKRVNSRIVGRVTPRVTPRSSTKKGKTTMSHKTKRSSANVPTRRALKTITNG